MAQICTLYQVRNVLLAHDALIELTSKPGAKMTITQSPFAITVEFENRTFTAEFADGKLDAALFQLAQQCLTNRRFKTIF